jgi:predicted nucleotidyltransferase
VPFCWKGANNVAPCGAHGHVACHLFRHNTLTRKTRRIRDYGNHFHFCAYTYVAIALVQEFRQLRKDARKRPVPPLDEVRERELLEGVLSWLAIHLADPRLHITQAFLFGSVVRDHYATRDVDLAVEFTQGLERRASDRLRNKIAVQFKKEFQRQLHLKFCTVDELSDFLRRTGNDHKKVILQPTRTLLTYFFPLATDISKSHER